MTTHLNKSLAFLIVILVLFFLQSCDEDLASSDFKRITKINHKSSIVTYHGRMIRTDSCLVSGWSFWNKTPLKFNITDADTLNLQFLVKTITAKAYIRVKIDSISYSFDQQPNINDTLNFTISNLDKKFHKIEINMYLGFCSFGNCLNLTEVVGFAGAAINDGTFLKSFKKSIPSIAFVGDSWGFQIPENINSSKYNLYSTSLAGGTSGSYFEYYHYKYKNTPHILELKVIKNMLNI